MTKQPSLAQIRRNFKIDTVMERTGCTYEQAKAALVFEKWDVAEAILDIEWVKANSHA